MQVTPATAAPDAARQREAALREVLDLISRSRDDERPVFDAILRRAADLCDTPAAALILARPGDRHVRLVAQYGVDPATVALYDRGEVPMDPDISFAARAILTGKVVHLDDMMDTDNYRRGVKLTVTAAQLSDVRSIMFVPLVTATGAIGSIDLFRREVRPYTADEIALVETFAAQAVIAIENARQFRELQTRLEREKASAEILEVISQSRDDEQPVFDVILQSMARLCATSFVTLSRVNPEATHLVYAAHHGNALNAFDIGQDRWPLDSPIQLVRSVREGSVLHTPDLADTDLYRAGNPVRVRMVDQGGIRSFLTVPLITADRRAIGCIALCRQEVHPFTPDEIALVETFAAQAVIAIENVRQFRELQTRLAREAATREILEVISRSRDDETPVFDVLLRKAAQLCGAPMANLSIITDDGNHSVNAARWGEHRTDVIPIGSVWPLDLPYAPETCMREGRIVHIHDLADTDLYLSGDPARTLAVDKEGVRTLLNVPLVSDGRTIGCISTYRHDVRPFTADEIALVETFAAQAVIAIENVRQFRELQDSLEQQEATSDILRVISQSREDEMQVFDLIVEKAAVLCDADQGSLQIVNEARTHIRLMADWGHNRTAYQPGGEFSLDLPLSIVATIRTAKVVHIEDYSQSDAYRERDPIAVDLVETEGVRTRLNVPLLQDGIAIGCISLSRRAVRPFTPPEIQLVETFAAQAVIAIENVRQFRELQARLARETATRNILRVISESPDDEQPTFEAILDSATRLCGTPYASLVLGRKGDASQRMVAHRAATAETLAVFRDGRVPMDPEDSIGARAILEGRTIHVPDMADTDQYRAGHERFRLVVDQQGLRTNLFVPLMGPEGGIGCFILWKKEVAPFTADQIALMETFASHAVIAIENVRQFRELQNRLAREAATREILEVISRNPDDDRPVFDVILRNVIKLCAGDTSALLMGRKTDARMTMAAWRDRESGSSVMDDTMIAQMNATDMRMDPKVHVTAQAITEARNIHVLDIRQHPSYLAGEPSYRIMGDALGVRSALVVPLIDARGALGTVHVHRRDVRPFTDDEIAIVETFAAQAVIAIENVRQFKALEALNAELGDRVQDQVGEIERMGRLKRFLPAAVADAVISSGSERMLSSHRALLGVLFCDIRGFTAFCETAEPEETIEVLQTYHDEMGRLIEAHGAGVDHRMGDGIMVLFNDPLPCDDPAGTAVRLAMAMRDRMAELCKGWKKMGHRLGFGVGISLGYATVGIVGSGGRFDYTASGTAVNLAARLCDEAQDGEILISPRARTAVDGIYAVESRGECGVKGIREPVEVFSVTGAEGA